MIENFNLPNIRLLRQFGVTVEVACNFVEGNSISEARIQWLKAHLEGLGVILHQVDFSRSPFHLNSHARATKQLLRVHQNADYTFVHCHAPIPAALTRILNVRKRKPTIYTVHGFHFYRGAAWLNWLTYYPIERILSRWTDTLITVNYEDYERAKRMGFTDVRCSPGVGVQVEHFSRAIPARSANQGQQFDFKVVRLLSVGELNSNKNHEAVIRALALINNVDLVYSICGKGNLADDLMILAEEMGVADRVHLLGYQSNMTEIYSQADIFIFPSKREGLPVSVIEAMSAGLPIIASRIRGVTDLVGEGTNGLLVAPSSTADWAEAITRLADDSDLRARMATANAARAAQFSQQSAMQVIEPVYRTLLDRSART